jgi:hypothetical protein
MLMARNKLARFLVTQDQDGFLLAIEDEAGETTELVATRDQLDLIADTIDEQLDSTEADDAVED